MLFFLFFLSIYYIGYRIYDHFKSTEYIDPKDKYVLITGCDTGFGNFLAHELDKQGFNVLAGVLNQSSIDVLKSELTERATVFRLDITKEDDIDSAFNLVQTKTEVLHALVNNAGIGRSGYIDWVSIEEYRLVMDVNYFGQVAMVKKFLPLLITKADSRVVNICSILGFTSPPGISAYCASKFAFESFSDCLRREMAPWNLRVSIIEPGWLRTGIIRDHDLHLRKLWNKLPSTVRERWGQEFFDEKIEKVVKNNIFIRNAEDPMKVVRALQHAVSSNKPRIRYRPDLQGSFIFFPLSLLPSWIFDKLVKILSFEKCHPAGIQYQKE